MPKLVILLNTLDKAVERIMQRELYALLKPLFPFRQYRGKKKYFAANARARLSYDSERNIKDQKTVLMMDININ